MSAPQSFHLWSATPTPLNAQKEIDPPAVAALIEHHVDWQIEGIMLCGSCGEGPWLSDADREKLVRTAAEAARGRIRLAVQVTDNSARRILENVDRVAQWGAEVAVVAQPYFLPHSSSKTVAALTHEVIDQSALPVCFYDRGAHSTHKIDTEHAAELCAHPNVCAIKDSSSDPERAAAYLDVKKRRPDLLVMNGNEFDCANYLQKGYDGLFLGGAIFNGRLATRIAELVAEGDREAAQAGQDRMNDLMWRVYGGKEITCWLAGLKYLLTQMGLFSTWENLLDYTLTDECRQQIDEVLSGSGENSYAADLRTAALNPPH